MAATTDVPSRIPHPRTLTNFRVRTPPLSEHATYLYDLLPARLRDPLRRMPGGDLIEGLAAFALSGRFDATLTVGVGPAFAFGLANRLSRRRRRQVVKELYFDETSLAAPYKRALVRWALRDVDVVVTNSTGEIPHVARLLDLGQERFQFVPWPVDPMSASVPGAKREETAGSPLTASGAAAHAARSAGSDAAPQAPSGAGSDNVPRAPAGAASDAAASADDFVFAGGRSFRDWPTLIDAVAGTGIRTVIVASAGSIDASRLPREVELRTDIAYAEYLTLLRHARLVVVPVLDTFRSAGQIALLEAMALGKPVIGTRAPGLADYIEHEVTGLTYEPGDAAGLAAAIRRLHRDEALRDSLARAALARTAVQFSPAQHSRSVLGAIARACA